MSATTQGATNTIPDARSGDKERADAAHHEIKRLGQLLGEHQEAFNTKAAAARLAIGEYSIARNALVETQRNLDSAIEEAKAVAPEDTHWKTKRSFSQYDRAKEAARVGATARSVA